jgi:Histidine phosphatase superfamily (branch 1)
VVIRLEPVIMELERSENVFIVTHQAVLRCIYAYYMDVPQERSPWLEVPLHTLIKLTPRAYKTHEERFAADIPAVSTFREKGSKARHQRGASLSTSNTPNMLPSPRLVPPQGIRDGGAPPTTGGDSSAGHSLPSLPELGPPAMGLGASGGIDASFAPHGRHLSVPGASELNLTLNTDGSPAPWKEQTRQRSDSA